MVPRSLTSIAIHMNDNILKDACVWTSVKKISIEIVTAYSQFPLNGHPIKADTSLKQTGGVDPWRTSVIYFISLQGRHLSKADSQSWSRACPP